ncbi:hypothetical protein NDU88_007405 [Pleurodeles waltl]|uniref:Uncharacterized protein n=1 Tax=Pleurodeles waltl TaxID=8319 RepID=A0AAV7UNQ6_PLEWA|nr:hypothetical protein NDU88_007405 [Pleurodeles waltl]
MPSGPSKEATGADASKPERDHVVSNPFELPGRRRPKTPVCGPGDGVVKEEDPAGGGESADETGETETEEERPLLRPVVTEDPFGRREPADSAREEAPDTTAAQEAFHDTSSHASGEAWPSQWVGPHYALAGAGAAPANPDDQRIPCLPGAVRSVLGREVRDGHRRGGPNRGRRVQAPGSRTRIPATLQEERGKGRVAQAVLKEYPGVLKDPLAPSDSCGVATRAVQEQCSGILGNPLTLSDSCGSVARAVQEQCSGVLENPLTLSNSCGSVARAVPSVLAGGTC